MNQLRRTLPLLASAGLLVLAGCGGSSDPGGASARSSTTIEARTTTTSAGSGSSTTTTTKTETTTTTAAPTTTAPPPVRWATADETLRNFLQYWKDGRLAEIQHLYEPGAASPDAELVATDPNEFDVSDPGSCTEYESKVGGVEAVCDIVLPSSYGYNNRFTVYLAPAPEGGYWLLRHVAYAGTEGGM